MPVTRAKSTVRLVAAIAVFGLYAFAQTSGDRFASDLRAKYGPPLARQTYVAPSGEMVVDYAVNGNVCKIHLPSMAPEKERPGVESSKAMDDFILDLVPLAVRGKEVNRLHTFAAAISASLVEYENVTVSEVFSAGRRTGVTVTFKTETCQDLSSAVSRPFSAR
jgi:hypothetical protein